MSLTPEHRSVIELLVTCCLVVAAFPLSEVIRLNFLTKWFPYQPRWRIAWRTGGAVLAMNLLYAFIGAPPIVNDDFPMWLALVIHFVSSFQIWLFILWALDWWDRGNEAKRKREERERERNG